jgi:hypothetical protein
MNYILLSLIKNCRFLRLFFYLKEKYFDMKKLVFAVFFIVSSLFVKAQVAQMNWSLDYQIFLKLANDSNYKYDIREAFHVKNSNEITNSDFVFYPANPGADFITQMPGDSLTSESVKTLWSALHAKIGGGWVHFINCLAYSFETQKLSLTSPLMVRTQSSWKPNPVTESYKRTKDWKYYVPSEQKLAQKEYKIRLSKNELGDLKSLPKSYIDLFLSTSQKQYNKLKELHKFNEVAKIDLVKLMLGSNYLGEAQISYIANSVLEAVQSYSSNMLPSVIIFDEYDAAAVMSLDATGYKIEKIVFKTSANLSEQEISQRSEKINQIVATINEYNSNSFKKRLGSYYKN